MILKKVQNFEMSTQRILGILDSKFKNNNKFIGKQTKANGLFLGTAASKQFTRPGQSTIKESTVKRSTIDHQQSQRQCFSITSCDLVRCYDRVVNNVALLALLRIGVSHSKTKPIFTTIQKMMRRIRTVFGDSDLVYEVEDIGSWGNYPQWVLQDNASGPDI